MCLILVALIMHQQAVAGNKIGVIVPDAEIVDLDIVSVPIYGTAILKAAVLP